MVIKSQRIYPKTGLETPPIPQPVLYSWKLAALWLVTLLALGTSGRAASQTIFPHVPMGGDIEGSIIINNPHLDETVAGILRFLDPSGYPRRVALEGFSSRFQAGDSACSEVAIYIAPGGTQLVRGRAGGTLSTGSAVLESNLPVAGFYRFRSGDVNVRLAAQAPTETAAFYLETLNGTDIGFAVANPQAGELWIEVLVVDGQGKVREAIAPDELNPLAGHAHYSRLISELGLLTIGNRAGWSVQLRSRGGGGFSTVAAVIEGSGFSSLPVVTDLRERGLPRNPAAEDR